MLALDWVDPAAIQQHKRKNRDPKALDRIPRELADRQRQGKANDRRGIWWRLWPGPLMFCTIVHTHTR